MIPPSLRICYIAFIGKTFEKRSEKDSPGACDHDGRLTHGERRGDRQGISGRRKNNKLSGTSRADIIYGFGGNDTLRGVDGDDDLYGGQGADPLLGGAGKDDLYGGDGNDGIDELSGGNNDTINARDGGPDIVNRGLGVDDTVFSDPEDQVAADCENVN